MRALVLLCLAKAGHCERAKARLLWTLYAILKGKNRFQVQEFLHSEKSELTPHYPGMHQCTRAQDTIDMEASVTRHHSKSFTASSELALRA